MEIGFEAQRRERERFEFNMRNNQLGGYKNGEPLPLMTLKSWLAATKDMPDYEWLIPGLIRKDVLSLMYAHGGVGKSLLMKVFMLASVTQKSIMGMTLPKLRWAYLDLDAPVIQTRDYIHKLCRGMDIDFEDDALEDIRLITMVGGEDHSIRETSFWNGWMGSGQSRELASQVLCNLRDTCIGVDVLVIDSFADAFSGGDENSNDDVTRFFKKMTKEFNSVGVKSLVFIHHSHKAGGGGLMNARGCTAITAKPRSLASMSYNKSKDACTIVCEKPRGFSNIPFYFRFQNYNECGEPCGILEGHSIRAERLTPQEYEDAEGCGECNLGEVNQQRKSEKDERVDIAYAFIVSRLDEETEPVGKKELFAEAKESNHHGSRRAFDEALERLSSQGYLRMEEGNGRKFWLVRTP